MTHCYRENGGLYNYFYDLNIERNKIKEKNDAEYNEEEIPLLGPLLKWWM